MVGSIIRSVVTFSVLGFALLISIAYSFNSFVVMLIFITVTNIIITIKFHYWETNFLTVLLDILRSYLIFLLFIDSFFGYAKFGLLWWIVLMIICNLLLDSLLEDPIYMASKKVGSFLKKRIQNS